ncbi:hypothetical protein L0U85_13235 [Glycomyces sp. L485]|uniref:hypothetical protein n=1 Tax=Glycomyces sp. L485 TaxID=2909235 RepID=UPI001F4A47D0|nr:hypothetical protein [Glycomyces sp. L485]MCH7231808.1 hypothetical protein [Glycomyces sp. L485]
MTDGASGPGQRPSDRIAQVLAATGNRIERLRMAVLVIAGVAVLLVVAVLWAGRTFTLDPTRRAVDELDVPAWAATSVGEETYGSRWCLGECRVRVRTLTSEGTVEDTARVYWLALLENGWLPAEAEKCIGGEGDGGCYVRDELFLELWVTPVTCGDRYELCVGSEVTAVVASQAALPRLVEDRGTADMAG